MNVNSNNYRQYTLFALFLIGLSTLLTYLISLLFSGILSALPTLVPLFIAVPTVPAIYAALFFLFDRYLWKFRFFKQIGIVVADDLNGTWTGFIKSSYDEFKSDIPAELKVAQTATSIKIHGKFNQSRSVSVFENFARSDMRNQTVLYYFYKNDPNYDAPATMAMHEGATILSYDAEDDVLSGYYYSGRDRNNYGTVKLHRALS